jgi:serine phosphatase RsbU (regulator of sigma subunit)
MFGKERLKTLIRENHRKSSAAIIAAVIDSLASFRKDARPEDDASLVVVKIVP